MSYKFDLPIYGVNKKSAISLNWYRNAHYRTCNSAKKEFKRQIREQIYLHDQIKGSVKIRYYYYAKRKGTDLDNFVGVVKKFFQDALVECGLIPDDNVSVICSSSEIYCGVDKDNPRVEAVIIPYDDI